MPSTPSQGLPQTMDELDLPEKEVQTLVAAMAGNFPDSLEEYRMPLLRKLAKAKHQLELNLRDA